MNRNSILALVFLAFGATAQAAEDGALSLSPAVVMLQGDYGQSTKQTLTMRNGTSRPFSFDVVAQDVVVINGKRTFVEAGSIPGSIAATAVFSTQHVDVPPGGSVSVTMTVTLPSSTAQRAVVAMFRGTNRVMSGNVPMTASIGSLLTFSMSGEMQMSAAPLSVQPQTASANLGVSHACTNAGSEPFVAKGVMAILDGKGALVGRAAIDSRRLLPGESAQFGGDYAGELDPGRYRLLVTYDYEGRTLSQSAEVEIR